MIPGKSLFTVKLKHCNQLSIPLMQTAFYWHTIFLNFLEGICCDFDKILCIKYSIQIWDTEKWCCHYTQISTMGLPSIFSSLTDAPNPPFSTFKYASWEIYPILFSNSTLPVIHCDRSWIHQYYFFLWIWGDSIPWLQRYSRNRLWDSFKGYEDDFQGYKLQIDQKEFITNCKTDTERQILLKYPLYILQSQQYST